MVTSQERQHRLSSIAHQLREIESSRAPLLRQLEDLYTAAQDLKVEYNRILYEGAAVSLLPNEILAAIFKIGYLQSSDDQVKFETLVSGVTRHWRYVALETPILWTRIRRTMFQTDMERTAVYLDRSKTLPIDLVIFTGSSDPWGHRDNIKPFVELIGPHVGRFRRLSVTAVTESNLNPLFDYVRTLPAPLLESIDIRCHSIDLSANPANIREIFTGGAPSLASFRLTGVGLHRCLPPLATMTHLRIISGENESWTSAELFCSMLSSAISARHIELHGHILEHWGDSQKVFLPSLRTLSISTDCGVADEFIGPLNTITAPLLEVLSSNNFYDHDIEGLFDSSLLGASSKFPSLRSIKLLFSFVSAPGLHLIARAFPAITDVTYQNYHDDLLVSLREPDPYVSGSTACYWPHLQTITLVDYHGSPTDVGEFLASRSRMGHPIKKLFLPETIAQECQSEAFVNDFRVDVYQPDLAQPDLSS